MACRLLVGTTLLLVFTVGCGEDVSIRTYRVAKNDARGSVTPVTRTQSAAVKDQLMLAAIVPNQDFAWFFKLTGDPTVVRETTTSFREMVQSVAFDSSSGQPSWKLPEGWTEQITPNDITYGKLNHGESGLTATVTRLPFTSESTQESWRGYVVSNVNRWRNQLSLSQQAWDEMSSELVELPNLSQGVSTAFFVSLEGKGSASPGMGPFMGAGAAAATTTSGAAGPSGSAGSSATSPPAAQTSVDQSSTASTAKEPAKEPEKPIRYEVPEGWSETPASGMRMAAFSIAEGQQSGEVTVIAAGGEIDANIGIWLGQVGMEASEENKQATLQAAEALSVNATDAKLYHIQGSKPTAGESESDTVAESILITDIPWREGQSLFVKFKGPSAMAAAQHEKFVEFVKSIQW